LIFIHSCLFVSFFFTQWRRFAMDAALWKESFEKNFPYTINFENTQDTNLSWPKLFRFCFVCFDLLCFLISFFFCFSRRYSIEQRWKKGILKHTNVIRGHSQAVFCARILKRHHYVTASADETVRVWKANRNL